MPQMSPLGWAWMIFFVLFGYYLFMVLFYFVFSSFFSIFLEEFKLKSFSWLW